MPLHVNLYHEVQRQELARRRDPLRLSMLAVLLIAIGFVVNYFVVLERAHSAGVAFSALNDQWTKIQPQAKAAKAREDELNAEISASDAMTKTIESRISWAPILDEVLNTMPRSVQLLHLNADSPGNEKDTDSRVAIGGISSSAEPRKEAEAVRIALEKNLGTKFKQVTSIFRGLEDSDQLVVLDGRRLPTATFELEFDVQVRDTVADAAAPAAAPHKERSEAAE